MALPPRSLGNDRMDAPAQSAAAVTPSNSADLATPCRALYIGTAGDVLATLIGMDDDTFVKFVGMPVGVHPVACKRIWADDGASPVVDSTTATGIVALF